MVQNFSIYLCVRRGQKDGYSDKERLELKQHVAHGSDMELLCRLVLLAIACKKDFWQGKISGTLPSQHASKACLHCDRAGPSSLNLSKAVTEIECRHQGVALKAMELDLASVSSIIKFAIAVEELVEAPNAPTSLQLLVNNAGILAASRRLTSEGCDYMIASNYLGHFMLTQLLLSLLRRSSNPARIVNVASFTHRCVKRLQVNLECLAKGEMHKLGDSREDSELYSIAHIYEESKLSMVMFTYELHRRLYISDPLSQISVMAADPGIVQTGIFREFPSWLSYMAIAFLRLVRLMQLPNDGCQSVIDAALAPAEMSGQYFFGGNGRTLTSSSLSYDQEAARNLWETSFALHIATISRQTSIIQKK